LREAKTSMSAENWKEGNGKKLGKKGGRRCFSKGGGGGGRDRRNGGGEGRGTWEGPVDSDYGKGKLLGGTGPIENVDTKVFGMKKEEGRIRTGQESGSKKPRGLTRAKISSSVGGKGKRVVEHRGGD